MKNAVIGDDNRDHKPTEKCSDRVLLAHPAAVIRHSVRAMLEAEGCSVLEADDGFSALASLVEHEPTAVVADIMLARLDGYQLCALIRNHLGFRKTPVILLASSEDLYDQTRAELVGSTAYACQPLSSASFGVLLRGAQ